MSAQERFDRALEAMAAAEDATPYEYDVDEKADALRLAETSSNHYSWQELPEHVRDYWRERASE